MCCSDSEQGQLTIFFNFQERDSPLSSASIRAVVITPFLRVRLVNRGINLQPVEEGDTTHTMGANYSKVGHKPKGRTARRKMSQLRLENNFIMSLTFNR